MGPANIARARSSILSVYYIVTAINTTPFMPYGTAAVPFPLTVIFNGI